MMGHICDLTEDYLLDLLEEQGFRCFFSGREMLSFSKEGRPTAFTMSLDRLDSSLPYMKGNVAWCCYTINIMKRRQSVEEFLGWARDISRCHQ